MAIVIGRISSAPAQPHPRLVRLGREVGAEFPAPPRHRSYLYHFTGSFDEPRDVEILKELIFWASVRHQDDALLRVVRAAPDEDDFVYHQKAFGVTESPCLVISDRGDVPASHVKLGRDFFATGMAGGDYAALRNLLEHMHALLGAYGMEKARAELLKLSASPQPS